MKLPESAALFLFEKQGFPHPDFFIGPPADKDFLKKHAGKRFVVKADIPVGGKKKAGLVQFAVAGNLNQAMTNICATHSPNYYIETVLVEEFVEHDKEYYLAIKAVREGMEVFFSELGGIDIEANWDKVARAIISTEEFSGINGNSLKLEKLVGESKIRDWITKLVQFFQNQDATYLEINPFTIIGEKIMPLGVVLEVDDAARFRHPDWPEIADVGSKTEREKKVAEIDSQIKGSVKLVEVKDPSGKGELTAIMGGGAGSVLFLCDAILEKGFKLANYAEFSGNPPSWALTELTKQVCAIPGIKNLVIGSGIANFTPVVPNFEAIIKGFQESPQTKNLKIVVRRCGPGEEEGIAMMQEFAAKEGYNIQVFGRETGMTDIIKSIKQ